MVPYPPTYRIRRPASGWVQASPAPASRDEARGSAIAVFLSIIALALAATIAVRFVDSLGMGKASKAAAAPTFPEPPPPPPPTRIEDDVTRLDALVASVEANAGRYARARVLCPAVDKSAQIPTALAGDRESFMTSARVRTALDRASPEGARAKAAHEAMSAPYLAVVVPGTREVVKRGASWNASFEGWLFLVDTKTGQPVCGTSLAFESTTKPKDGRRENAVMRALRDDLEGRFHRESAIALGTIAGKNLTLEN